MCWRLGDQRRGWRPWVCVGPGRTAGGEGTAGPCSIGPGQRKELCWGSGFQAAEHCDLICIFIKALSEGCVIAKDRTHSQDHTWRLVNVERYTSVSLSRTQGLQAEGSHQEPGQPLCLPCLQGLSAQPLCASLNKGSTQALHPLPCVQPYRDSLTRLPKYYKFPEERS